MIDIDNSYAIEIKVPPNDGKFDSDKQEFIPFKGATIKLIHSLISISKWEARWKKSFLSRTEKTHEETIDYIKCMTVTQNVDNEVYSNLTQDNIKDISDYIQDSMTATWFSKEANGTKINNETTTSELIYYWMVALEIPFECQKWHLNRLLTLIRVCNIKQQKPTKIPRSEIAKNNHALNAARRAKHHTKG